MVCVYVHVYRVISYLYDPENRVFGTKKKGILWIYLCVALYMGYGYLYCRYTLCKLQCHVFVQFPVYLHNRLKYAAGINNWLYGILLL